MLTAMAISAVLCGLGWIWALPFFCGAIAMFRMAWSVFANYEDKCRLMKRLKEKLANGYDRRYFLPYMGTACYRHVVYFALADFGLQGHYPELHRHYREWGVQREKPKTTRFRIVDRKSVV